MPTSYADPKTIYEKDKKLKPEDVKNLREWVDKQPHLPDISELQSILFLHSCYYSNEAAKNALDTYFTVKTLCPDIFGNKDPRQKALQDSLKIAVYMPLPKKTPEGYTVIFAKLMDSNPDLYVFQNQLRNFDMSTMLWLQQNGPSEGYRIVMDMNGITFGHLTKLGLIPMKKFLYYLQEGMPLRLKGLHYFNVVPFMDKILALMKPFMKKELMDVLHLHENVESLSEFVPVECLPQDYGGTVDSLQILHEKMKQNITDNADYFLEEEKQIVDESKRPGKPRNENDVFGVEGTFKKLDID